MLIIVVTVLVEGLLVPSKDRGHFNIPILTINGGIFQAIGVISFGESLLAIPPQPSLLIFLFLV